ncbi:MAG: hypothetical protein ABI439_07535 [Rhodospirillales bacterium]
MDQIREAIISNAGMESRLESFRLKRLDRIITKPPFKFKSGIFVVLHIMPLVGATGGPVIDVVNDRNSLLGDDLPGFFDGSASINIDGCCWKSEGRTDVVDAYYQWFRNGCFEALWTIQPASAIDDDPRILPVYNELEYGEYIGRAVAFALKSYSSCAVPPPYIVGVSLLNTVGWILGQARNRPAYPHKSCKPVTDDRFDMVEITIENSGADVPAAIRPILTQIANAFGLLESGNYKGPGWLGKPII